MLGKSAKQLALLERRRRVSELRLRGWTQDAIAAELGVAQPTVCGDLRIVREEWRQSMVDDCAEARAEELEKVAQVERAAWDAWERSQQPAVTLAGGDESQAAPRRTVRNRHGDLRCLAIVLDCIATRRAILGLDAPQKLTATDAEGRTLTITDLLIEIDGRVPAESDAGSSPPCRANVIDVAGELARRDGASGPADRSAGAAGALDGGCNT